MSKAIADRMRLQAERLITEADKLRSMADALDPQAPEQFAGYSTSGKLKVEAAPRKKPTWRDPAGKKPTGKLTTGG